LSSIIAVLAEGLGNKEIAEKLHIATETVKTHLQNIYVKLHAKGRIAVLKEARALGLNSLI
jgi:DNA-binding NarL/FixJ family response regulator